MIFRSDCMFQSKAKWIYEAENDEEKEMLHSQPVINQLLIERSIETKEELDDFLYTKVDNLHSPKLYSEMNKTVDRIRQAITSQERNIIYGDYDEDGVSSLSLLYETLIELDGLVSYYIPKWFEEGYGLNKNALQKIYEHDYTLVITVDNGISSLEEANYAKEIGLDLIITDHHEVQKELPNAYAIIHPKLSEKYPFKELAGVGVVFKLAEAILGYFHKHL